MEASLSTHSNAHTHRRCWRSRRRSPVRTAACADFMRPGASNAGPLACAAGPCRPLAWLQEAHFHIIAGAAFGPTHSYWNSSGQLQKHSCSVSFANACSRAEPTIFLVGMRVRGPHERPRQPGAQPQPVVSQRYTLYVFKWHVLAGYVCCVDIRLRGANAVSMTLDGVTGRAPLAARTD